MTDDDGGNNKEKQELQDDKKSGRRGDGSIFKQLGSRNWWISYYGHAGKRIRESTGTTNRTAALRTLRARLNAVDKGEPVETRRRQHVTCGELFRETVRDYTINGRKTTDALERRWNLHLKPVFEHAVAARLADTTLINDYIDQRLATHAKPASVNRELSALKRTLRLGLAKHKYALPPIPHLEENNVRKGFI